MRVRGAGDTRVVYEVDLDLEAAIAADYVAWLQAHVREILALPGFLEARVSQVEEPAAEPDRAWLCVHYVLRDAAALEAYLRDHAPRLRAEGQVRFGGRFQARRRILRVLSEHDATHD